MHHLCPPYFAWKCSTNKMLEDIDKFLAYVNNLYYASLEWLAHGRRVPLSCATL